jgi:hypothetical protein
MNREISNLAAQCVCLSTLMPNDESSHVAAVMSEHVVYNRHLYAIARNRLKLAADGAGTAAGASVTGIGFRQSC